MRIRSDFVTNSSSSSFVIVNGKKFTQKQKNIIADYIVKALFGEIVIKPTDNMTEEDWENELASYDVYVDEDTLKRLAGSVKEGEEVHADNWPDSSEKLNNLCLGLFRRLSGVDGFKVMYRDLS